MNDAQKMLFLDRQEAKLLIRALAGAHHGGAEGSTEGQALNRAMDAIRSARDGKKSDVARVEVADGDAQLLAKVLREAARNSHDYDEEEQMLLGMHADLLDGPTA